MCSAAIESRWQSARFISQNRPAAYLPRTTLLRPILRPLLLLTLATSAAHADTTASNATQLRDALRGSAPAAELQDIPLDSGCGPAGCVVDIGPLRIQREQGLLQRIDGSPLHWQAQSGLPELDWSPLGAYQVTATGKPWGICLELSHSGLGKSGVYQRWSSVVLVPADGDQAYRLVGYWAGCDSLQTGAEAGHVVLPIISQQADHGLHVLNYHCDPHTCEAQPSAISVEGDPNSETGVMNLR